MERTVDVNFKLNEVQEKFLKRVLEVRRHLNQVHPSGAWPQTKEKRPDFTLMVGDFAEDIDKGDLSPGKGPP